MTRIALTMNSACLLEVHTCMILTQAYSTLHSTLETYHNLFINFVVAMIAAAQGDVVIDIEKSPIVKTEVNNIALTKVAIQYFPAASFY